jgi:branched-chain amino acid transport system substrate-binding protein
MRLCSRLIIFIILLNFLFPSNSEARRPSRTPLSVARIYAQADANREVTKIELKAYINSNSDKSQTAIAMLYLGELHRLDGKFGKSRFWFQKIIDEFPTSEHKIPAQIGLVLIQSEENTLSGNGLGTLQLHENLELPTTMKADQFRLLALNAESMEESTVYAERASAILIAAPEVINRISRDLSIYLPSLGMTGDISNEERLYAQIMDSMQSQSFTQVKALAEEYTSQWPEGDYGQYVDAFKERAEAGDPFSVNKVGVLLPLSGDYSHFSEQIKGSLEFGAQDSGVTFVWYDTEGNPDKAVEGVKDLTLQGCSLILGPLLRDTTEPAAQMAQAYQIPMFSFSQSSNITDIGEYIFRTFVSTNDQVEALLNHAIDIEGWNKFTVLAPNTRYGEEVLQIFTENTEIRGGEVVHSVLYDPEATSFLEEAKKIGSKEKDDDEPIIDFDAFFIPDTFRVVPLVASSLAYEEFPVGKFRTTSKATPLGIMGLNGWNHPDISKAGGLYLQNGIFVDAFWTKGKSVEVEDFVKDFRAVNERNPTLYDALAIDAVKLAISGVHTSPANRTEMRHNLETVTISEPIAGGKQFDETRSIDRTLIIFIIKKDGITKWEAPKTP